MIPINADKLIELRKTGKKPSRLITLNIGDYGQWKGELTITPQMTAERLDLRCLVGLDVMMLAEHWTDREAAIYRKLQEYANEIFVAVVDFAEDIGWWWVKRWANDDGRIDFDKRHHFTEWENARAASTSAKNAKEYSGIRTREKNAYAALTGV
jgi:hypothetical protein